MEIAFIYPNMLSGEYADSLHLINKDISIGNRRLIVPNLILYAIKILLLTVWVILVRYFFFVVTRFVTAKELNVIVTWLFLYIAGSAFAFFLIVYGLKRFRPVFLYFINRREHEESFSFSEYVERKDSSKKALDELRFYNMCDLLKRSKVTDATATCNGSQCKVEVAYENSSGSNIFTFYLPYREKAGIDKVVVDLSRKCVIFPEEEERDDE